MSKAIELANKVPQYVDSRSDNMHNWCVSAAVELRQQDIKITELTGKLNTANALVEQLTAQLKAASEQHAIEIEWPDYHEQAMGCGLEDRNIHDRYEAMRYGWECALDRCAEAIGYESLYAAPVPAPQPASEPAQYMGHSAPHKDCDSGCMYQCTEAGAMPPKCSEPAQSEREAFEVWYKNEVSNCDDTTFLQNGDGSYLEECVRFDFEVWQARAALGNAIPEGYQLVPIEATPEMRTALWSAKFANTPESFNSCYQAILAAAAKGGE